MAGTPGAGVIHLPALGRPFRLGRLYDCRSDTLIPGVTLWDPDALANDKLVSEEQAADFQVIMEDSLGKKSNALDIDASLKLSFLGGLVQVSGSAHYLDDRKTSQHQERVTLKYRTATRFEELTMKQLGKGNMTHMEVFDHGTATHVVTGVRYGGQAFFVFDRQVSSNENQREIAGSLHVLVKALPGIVDIEGSASVKLTEDEQNNANKFQCQFYGDFCPKTNPTTYKEAAILYHDLPKLLGENGERAVPLEVWLYPLELLDSKAAKLVRVISKDIVQKVETTLEQLHEIDIRCSDLLASSACQNFKAIREDIFYFSERTKQFGLAFREEILPILPSIRGGGAKESQLLSVLQKREASPFSHRRLKVWVEQHEVEIKVLDNYITSMAHIRFISKANLPIEILNLDTKVVVCFMIRLAGDDVQATAMKNYLERGSAALTDDTKLTSVLNETIDVMVQNARRFKDFSLANKKTPGLAFNVVEDPDTTGERGGFIDVYKAGRLIHENYAPPSQPGRPQADEWHHDKLILSWARPDVGQEEIRNYEVYYREFASSSSDWSPVIHTSSNSIVLEKLSPATPYQVKVRAVCDFGFSQYSEVSEAISTRPTSPPGKPTTTQISPTTVMVTWTKPEVVATGVEIDSYTLNIKDMNSDTWLKSINSAAKKGTEEPFEISLETRRQYYVQVHANCKTARSLDSEQSIPIMMEVTDVALMKYRILCASEKVTGTTDMPIYQVPLKTVVSQSIDMTCKCTFGKEKFGVTEKVIMVAGATGAGKTTLINGMFNHILGMEFSDKYRFRLIQEDQSAANQAKSQTQYITAYTIHHQDGYTVPFTLTIIDTPGFGDTTGIERDERIKKQIHSFFSTTGEGGIDHIDAVGFVIQASLPRLTPTQKYVFDSILSLFGKDIAENIFLLLPFADKQKPPVLAGVKEASIMYKKYYKFNNSAIYADNDETKQAMFSDDEDDDEGEGTDFESMCWEMSMKSFNKFLTGLNKIQPQSLQLTKDVLDERGRLELHVGKITEDITCGLNKLDRLNKEVAILERRAADVARSRNFKYTVTEDTLRKVDLPAGQYAMTCLMCNRTCHERCDIADNENKSGCWAMSNGFCQICPGKCIWNMHKSLRYMLKIEQRIIQKESEDLKRRYMEAEGRRLTSQQIVSKLRGEYTKDQSKVLDWTDEVRRSLNRLQEIALKPHSLAALDYIDMLILSEKNEARAGWKERVEQLSKVRKKTEYLDNITKEGFGPS